MASETKNCPQQPISPVHLHFRSAEEDGALPSSTPPSSLSVREGSTKLKRPPSVTPRTFKRFFTPRPSLKRGKRIGASRQALRDITTSAMNQRQHGRNSLLDGCKQVWGDNDLGFQDIGHRRKRRLVDPDQQTPENSSPLKIVRGQHSKNPGESIFVDEELLNTDTASNESNFSGDEYDETRQSKASVPPRLARSQYRGQLGSHLRRELDFSNGHIGSRRSHLFHDWRSHVSSFHTRREDSLVCSDVDGHGRLVLPFCVAGCNTNPLVAIGDEEGGIRVVESARDGNPPFSEAYITLKPHPNAILDLTFSSDDLLVATASGDQTSQVIDMPSQRPTHVLAGHSSSVKQVRFQPGSTGNIVATCSRDGSVRIWDLRCKGFETPVRHLQNSSQERDQSTNVTVQRPESKVAWARPVNTILRAHANALTPYPVSPTSTHDHPSRNESLSQCRRSEVSITALEFLPPGREHFIVTASEANASVKLWDLRTAHSRGRAHPTPLSTTRQPESHDKNRQFGLTSMEMSGDGSRIFTLCRDNTIYAYATSHLVLGSAPNSSLTFTRGRRAGAPEKEGLGPLFGFRHPALRAASFYVKLSLRPAKDDRTELLAAGSSDGCAVVFPTDECFLKRHSTLPLSRKNVALQHSPSKPGLTYLPSLVSSVDDLPIYTSGTPLIRGHDAEINGLGWTSEGNLVTAGDNREARCWRSEEDGSEAKRLRACREGDAERWMRGWAEIEDGWDESE